jgi:hypothetical protein
MPIIAALFSSAGLKIMAIVGLVGAVLFGYLYFEHMKAQLNADAVTIGTLQANVAAQKAELAIQQDATNLAITHLQDMQNANQSLQLLIAGAHNAPSSSDGSLAPVLRDALVGIDGLRKPAPAPAH